MRVLHLAPDPESPNGIAAYADHYRNALALAGIDVVRLHSAFGDKHSFSNVRRYRMRAADEALKGYDIVHAELGGGALREFYALQRVQSQTTVSTVATLHDPPGAVWWPFHVDLIRQSRVAAAGVRLVGSGVAAEMEHRVVKRLDAVFTLTHAGAEALGHALGESVARRTVALPYPLTSQPAEPAAAGSRSETEPDRPFVIGFFGYWYEGKGLLGLVEALSRLRAEGVNFRAYLWGDVSRDAGLRLGRRYRRKVLEALAAEGLSEIVEVPGFLEHSAVRSSLGACDVIVLPYETSSVTDSLRSASAALFDAFAAGTPVIATDVKALDEQVRHGENGLLVPPADTAALVDALRRLIGDRALLERLRTGARQRAETLRLVDCATAAIDVYERLGRPEQVSGGAR